MIERDEIGIDPLDYLEDAPKEISTEKYRLRIGDRSSIQIIERLLENKKFYRSRAFDEKEGYLRYFSVSYPVSEETSVDCQSFILQRKKVIPGDLLVNVEQFSGADRLGQAWYDENGFLFQVYAYPPYSDYLRFKRETEEEGINWGSEEDMKRVEQLEELTTGTCLQILLLRGKKFFLKGILREVPVKEEMKIGFANSGEMIMWDEYYYKMTEKGNKLIIEVFSAFKRKLKRRLTFPREIQDYEQVFKLFTEDKADWKQIPKLIPVEVEFPGAV